MPQNPGPGTKWPRLHSTGLRASRRAQGFARRSPSACGGGCSAVLMRSCRAGSLCCRGCFGSLSPVSSRRRASATSCRSIRFTAASAASSASATICRCRRSSPTTRAAISRSVIWEPSNGGARMSVRSSISPRRISAGICGDCCGNERSRSPSTETLRASWRRAHGPGPAYGGVPRRA